MSAPILYQAEIPSINVGDELMFEMDEDFI
jgi:hypothetical protein